MTAQVALGGGPQDISFCRMDAEERDESAMTLKSVYPGRTKITEYLGIYQALLRTCANQPSAPQRLPSVRVLIDSH